MKEPHSHLLRKEDTYAEKPIIWSMKLIKGIKSKRKKLGLSQEEISFATGIDQSVYSKIERGVKKPAPCQINSIKQFLKIKKL